jgi:amphi-Trp domain-containing protein
MKTKKRLSRYAIASRLQSLALQIASGKPVRIGSSLVCIPSNAVFEEEIETKDGETELELEIRWASSTDQSKRSKSPRKTVRS